MKGWQVWVIILGVFSGIWLIVCTISTWQNLNVDQTLSLTQVVIEAALVPIAVVGFAITIREFSRSQGKVDIRLEFENLEGNGYTQSLNLKIPETGGKGYAISISVVNSAPHVAIWWQIQFVIPQHLDRHPPIRISQMFVKEELGGAFTTISREDGYQITFLSNGQTALFQNVPLEIGKLHFSIHPESHKPGEYKIPYCVITDRGEPSHGGLSIELHPFSAK